MADGKQKRGTIRTAGVGLFPRHWATVDQVAKDSGTANRSAALRVIVDRYVEMEMLLAIAGAYNAQVITGQEAIERMAVAVVGDDGS